MSNIVKASFVRTLPPKQNNDSLEKLNAEQSATKTMAAMTSTTVPNQENLKPPADSFQVDNSRYVQGIGTMVNLEACVNFGEADAERIIAAATFKASEIEKEAQQKAKLMLESAKVESEGLFAKSEEDGFNAGYERGLAEAKALQEEKLRESINEIQYLIETINIERVQTYKEAEDELAKMAFEIAKKIMRQQVKVEKDSIPRMIEDIVKENETAFRIYLSEYNQTLFTRIDRVTREKIKELLPEIKVVILPNDDTEEIIQIETESGMIDAGISGQLERLKEVVLDAE